MTETLKKLIELQVIDTELFLLNRRMTEIPKALRSEQESYLKAVSELGKEEKACKELEEQNKKTMMDLEAAVEHTRQLKGKQGLVRKNVEYQALTQEIKMAEDSGKKHKAALEQQAASRQSMEERLGEKSKGIEAIKNDLLQKAAAAKQAVAELQEKINRQKLLRRDFAKQLNADILSMYNRLYQTRAPQVIVRVQRSTCTGCNIKVPAQVINDILKNDRLVTCETCARILFIEPGAADTAAE